MAETSTAAPAANKPEWSIHGKGLSFRATIRGRTQWLNSSLRILKAALAVHNDKRSMHDAPPLDWNDDCYEQAKRQANLCASKRRTLYGNFVGERYDQGQNISYASRAPPSSIEAVKAAVGTWYSEVDHPGYSFKNSVHVRGADHFTQLVWKSTKSVGMAVSDDGLYVVANYLPAGNVHNEFKSNVAPHNGHNYHLFGHNFHMG